MLIFEFCFCYYAKFQKRKQKKRERELGLTLVPLTAMHVALPNLSSSETIYGLFESVVVVAFQSVFHSEMHQNNIFFLKKNIFDINTSKLFKNAKKILI